IGGKNPSKTTTSNSSSGNTDLSVSKLNVDDGQLSIARAGSSQKPRVYDKVNIEVTGFSLTSAFPFKMTGNLPAGGSMKLDGKAGPIDSNDAALTPLDAKVNVQQMNLAASGFIDPASGIAGIADLGGNVASAGHTAKTSGTIKADKLQVAAKGSPAGKPVQLKYTVNHDLKKETGTLSQGDVAMGKAVAHLTGTYDAH